MNKNWIFKMLGFEKFAAKDSQKPKTDKKFETCIGCGHRVPRAGSHLCDGCHSDLNDKADRRGE